MEIPTAELEKFSSTDREQCGIIIEKGNSYFVIEVENAVPNDEDYGILLDDFLRVKKNLGEGEVIAGFFHTHLPHQLSSPSDEDFEGAVLNPGMVHCVYHVGKKSQVMYWFNSDDGATSS